ncbi:MAG: HAD-IC family P-type ATPase, partial [Anaerolineales bacterium]|nr:HAD-IC family P-type ATPase [Anaerolineales bacterium]
MSDSKHARVLNPEELRRRNSLKRKSPLFRKIILYIAATAAGAAVIALLVLLIRRLRERKGAARASETRLVDALPVNGLTEAEAAARQVEGRDNAILFNPPRSRKTLVREGTLTIFNLGLVAIALVQLIFGKFLDALISIGVLIFSVVASVFQNEFARLRLRELHKAARTTATVIRDGKARNIDPAEIVPGDAVAIGPGDLILGDGYLVGDGQLVVDESMVTGEQKAAIKGSGDPVFAGSFCLLGRGVYEVEYLGEERLIVTRLQQAEQADLQLTPIEQIVRRVLTVVLVIAFGLTAFALLRFARVEVPIPADLLIDAVSVILNLAPASLFFMIVLTYTAATADLSKFGALVSRARSVEELSQVDVVCFSKSGMISSSRLQLKPIDLPEEMEAPPEQRIRQLLGDFARSISSAGTINRLMASSFEGSKRPMLDEMPFGAIYGWQGIIIEDEDLKGVYILGEPGLLEGNLADLKGLGGEGEDQQEQSLPGRVAGRISSVGSRLTGLFRRSGKDSEADEDPIDGAGIETPIEVSRAAGPGPEETREPEENSSPGFLSKLASSVTRFMSPSDEEGPEAEIPPEEVSPEVELLFAYRPDTPPLYSSSGEPKLPGNLIPLCRLELHEQVQPEAMEAARAFDQ